MIVFDYTVILIMCFRKNRIPNNDYNYTIYMYYVLLNNIHNRNDINTWSNLIIM